jgi:hypothetical protein
MGLARGQLVADAGAKLETRPLAVRNRDLVREHSDCREHQQPDEDSSHTGSMTRRPRAVSGQGAGIEAG